VNDVWNLELAFKSRWIFKFFSSWFMLNLRDLDMDELEFSLQLTEIFRLIFISITTIWWRLYVNNRNASGWLGFWFEMISEFSGRGIDLISEGEGKMDSFLFFFDWVPQKLTYPAQGSTFYVGKLLKVKQMLQNEMKRSADITRLCNHWINRGIGSIIHTGKGLPLLIHLFVSV